MVGPACGQCAAVSATLRMAVTLQPTIFSGRASSPRGISKHEIIPTGNVTTSDDGHRERVGEKAGGDRHAQEMK